MHISKVLFVEFETHDTLRFIVEKPAGFTFQPGNSVNISINKPEWKDQRRAFTITSIPSDPVLEFIIKVYPEGRGVTRMLHALQPGEEIVIWNVFGSIKYNGNGVFLAGGAGIAPFVSILRQLQKDGQLQGNMLLYSSKEHKDIIMERELKHMLGENCYLTLSREKREGYEHGRINREYILSHVTDFTQEFYICGPPLFLKDCLKLLAELKAKASALDIG